MRCTLCPRECGIDREKREGYCSVGSQLRVAKIMLHMWEEPCISGKNGSGAIFFSGCPLKCAFCQNRDISHGGYGDELTPKELGDKMLELQAQGAHNINLVSPTQFSDRIREAIDLVRDRLKIPVVYNTGGYEKSDIIAEMAQYVDVFLVDMKYYSDEISRKYSLCGDYYERATEAFSKMLELQPECVLDENGIMMRGVILRHLVLPSHRADSINLLEDISRKFDVTKFKLSLMSQYTPDFYEGESRALRRRLTTFEYQSVVERAIALGYDGYMQGPDSASKKYTPDFKGEQK